MNDPVAGDVWHYPYLWAWQQDRGETEGRKDRPTAIVAAVHDDKGRLHIALLPITSQPPRKDRISMVIPLMEARRIGLTTAQPLWIVFDDYNFDDYSESYYFELGGRIGALSSAFLALVTARFIKALADRKSRRIRLDT